MSRTKKYTFLCRGCLRRCQLLYLREDITPRWRCKRCLRWAKQKMRER